MLHEVMFLIGCLPFALSNQLHALVFRVGSHTQELRSCSQNSNGNRVYCTQIAHMHYGCHFANDIMKFNLQLWRRDERIIDILKTNPYWLQELEHLVKPYADTKLLAILADLHKLNPFNKL